MAGKKSVARAAVSREDKKSVRNNQAQEKRSDYKPSWRFSTVDLAGPFAWPRGQVAEASIVEKLHSFDSMTWSEIEGEDHHFLSPDKLSKDAQRRLSEIKLDDEIDQLFSFHLQGKPRVICIRHNNVARLLWYDADHGVCPSQKKNT